MTMMMMKRTRTISCRTLGAALLKTPHKTLGMERRCTFSCMVWPLTSVGALGNKSLRPRDDSVGLGEAEVL